MDILILIGKTTNEAMMSLLTVPRGLGNREKVARAAAEEEATLRSLDIPATEDYDDGEAQDADATGYATCSYLFHLLSGSLKSD